MGQHVSVHTERPEYTAPGEIIFLDHANRLREGVLFSFDTEWAETQKHVGYSVSD